MEKRPIEIPSLTAEEIKRLLPMSMVYPGLDQLFGHFSPSYLKNISTKMNTYTWFRFIEQESKSLIFKKMTTRMLYEILGREPVDCYLGGDENGALLCDQAVGLTSRGVNYKSVNEDGIGIFQNDDELVLVVCDGVGDCLVGEVASFVLLDKFSRETSKSTAQIFSESVETLVELSQQIIGAVPEFSTFPNEVSQAAITSVRIKDGQCEIGQVGDVLLYLFRNETVQLLDQNRNWLNLHQLNELFADEQYLAQRHIISNAIGRNYDPYWVPTFLDLEKDDVLILASDGLETLHPNEILEVLESGQDKEAMLNELYDRVLAMNLKWNTLGSPIYTKPDNISMLIYRHEG